MKKSKALLHWCVMTQLSNGSLQYFSGTSLAKMISKDILAEIRPLIEDVTGLAPKSYIIVSLSNIGEVGEQEAGE